jgi:MFS-type transporter involved in bile tolerance (Atg22 family)
VLAGSAALVFESAVALWYGVGTVVTSALLLPVLAVHVPDQWRPRPLAAVTMMLGAATTAGLWLIASRADSNLLGLEPMLAALIVSALVWVVDRALAVPEHSHSARG